MISQLFLERCSCGHTSSDEALLCLIWRKHSLLGLAVWGLIEKVDISR